MARQGVNTNCCPECGTTSPERQQTEDGREDPFFTCRNPNCGAKLARMFREGIFGKQPYFVNPARNTLEVHRTGRPKGE